jgi:hypothetical protein
VEQSSALLLTALQPAGTLDPKRSAHRRSAKNEESGKRGNFLKSLMRTETPFFRYRKDATKYFYLFLLIYMMQK